MYLLNSAEFAVLAAALGAERLTGFSLDTDGVHPAKALHALYKKGLLASTDDRDALSLDAPLKAALLRCINADRALCVLWGEERPPLLIYPHDEALTLVQPDEYIPDSFRIWSCARGDLPGALEDEGFTHQILPTTESPEDNMYVIEYAGGAQIRREACTPQSLADRLEEMLWGVYA